MLRKFVLGLAFAMAATSPGFAIAQETEQQALPALDPPALAIARQIVDLGYPVEKREELFFSVMDSTARQVRAAMPLDAISPDRLARFEEFIELETQRQKEVTAQHIPKLMDAYAQALAASFSVEDLTAILEFVKTDAGQKYFERSRQVLTNPYYAGAVQTYYNEAMGGMPERMVEFLKRDHETEAEKARDKVSKATHGGD